MSVKSWVLVPIEPTEEMKNAGDEVSKWTPSALIHAAMLSASPDPTTDEALVERVAWKIADALGEGLHGNSPGFRAAALAAIRAMEEKP